MMEGVERDGARSPTCGGASLKIVHLALGGCLRAPPVRFGITSDTGGHLAYVLDAATAQSAHPDVDGVEVVTRLFHDPVLGEEHARAWEALTEKLAIRRIATADRRYLEKDALADDLPDFTQAFCRHLEHLSRLPDVIHAHFADAAQVAAEAFRRFAIPFVYTPHALGIDKRREGGTGAALDRRIEQERTAIAGASAIVVSTRDEADSQLAAYNVPGFAERLHRIAPGVPVRRAAARPGTVADRLDEWLDDPGKPILLAIARPVAKKNIAALLRGYAASPALRSLANVVVLAGQNNRRSGAEEIDVVADLKALAATPSLRGRVALPERHDAADVDALYRRAAAGGVFVNPALHEPFGLTILEAAAAGAPVVATRAGGPADIVARIGHGLLIDPRDDGAIAAACRRILEDPALHRRLGAAGPRGAAYYDWDRYAEQSIRVYESVLAPPRLLACDIDGTLTGCPVGARAFADWATRRAIPFIVATGRSFDEAPAVLSRWGLPQPDAYVVDVGTRIMLRDDAGGWSACPDYAASLDRRWDRAAVIHALAALAIELQPAETQTPHKISFFGNAADAFVIRGALTDACIEARVIHSHGHLIDVLPPGGGKAAAVAHYAARLGLPLAACVAAGDSGNDLDMLAACGHAIVVANADADLAILPPRRGLYRARLPHAAGVIEGLAELDLAADARTAG